MADSIAPLGKYIFQVFLMCARFVTAGSTGGVYGQAMSAANDIVQRLRAADLPMGPGPPTKQIRSFAALFCFSHHMKCCTEQMVTHSI